MQDQGHAALKVSDEKRPFIYAYTTADRETDEWTHRTGGPGWIKVGYTEVDVQRRIAQQEGSPVPVKILFQEPAFTEDGHVFKDHSVHAALVEQGAHRLRRGSGTTTEWFETTLEEVQAAYNSVRTKGRSAAPWAFSMRSEQKQAVRTTARFFRAHGDERARQFLWNAKMRFGKTFAAYQLAIEMGWHRILILTFKPAAEAAWSEIINKHNEFQGWQFLGGADTWESIDESKPIAQMVSFQKLMGSDEHSPVKESLELVYAERWDCIVVDEYHFGAWRDGAKSFYDEDVDVWDFDHYHDIALPEAETLKAEHWLFLSGTPFRALAEGEFSEDQIFTWTYGDEQTKKHELKDDPASPYADLPQLRMYAYRMGDAVRHYAKRTFDDEFDLNVFFAAGRKDGRWRFKREGEVQAWLDWMHSSAQPGEPPSLVPFTMPEARHALAHSVWFLHNIGACRAMNTLLENDPYYSRFKIILAAGKSAGTGIRALRPVQEAIGDGTKTKTITLTCGKLLTGVTVPQWGAIFMLRNLNAAETYYQAAFRVQSPWSKPDLDFPNRKVVLKQKAYIFDFSPQRALDLIASYCSSAVGGDTRKQPDEVRKFLNFLPVLCYEGGKMVALDEKELLDYAYSGVGAAMLARRWQSPQLVNLDRDTLADLLQNDALCEALEDIEVFRNLRDHARKVVNTDDTLRTLRRERKRPDSNTKKEEKEAKKRREELRDKLLQFLCKVPLFMYLTDFREESLNDVIRRIETPLFVKVTGLQLDHFDELCRIGVFNERALNSSIYAFRRQEAVHLIEPRSTISSEH